MLLFTVISHALLATAFVPRDSDLPVYERYAGSVAAAIQSGRSFSIARDEIMRSGARRSGSAEPSSDDLLVEYPPLAVIWMSGVAIGVKLDDDPGVTTDAYDARYRLAVFALDLLVIVVLLAWVGNHLVPSLTGDRMSAPRLAVYGISGLLLGNLLFDRLDLIVGALLLFAVLFLLRGGWQVSFLLLAIAINFKASPVALAPLWVVGSLSPTLFVAAQARPIALAKAVVLRCLALVGLAAALFVPFLLIEGTRSLDFVRFRAIQGIQIESLPSSILLVMHVLGLPAHVAGRLGAVEIESPWSASLAGVSPLLIVVGAAAVCVAYGAAASGRLRRRVGTTETEQPTTNVGNLASTDSRVFIVATVATLLLTLVASKVLSPQYLIWLLPLIPLIDLGPARSRAFLLGFMALCAISTAIFPYLYSRTLARLDPGIGAYQDPTLLGVGLLVVRNALLVWLAWLAVRSLLEGLPAGSSNDAGMTFARR